MTGYTFGTHLLSRYYNIYCFIARKEASPSLCDANFTLLVCFKKINFSNRHLFRVKIQKPSGTYQVCK